MSHSVSMNTGWKVRGFRWRRGMRELDSRHSASALLRCLKLRARRPLLKLVTWLLLHRQSFIHELLFHSADVELVRRRLAVNAFTLSTSSRFRIPKVSLRALLTPFAQRDCSSLCGAQLDLKR